MFIGVKLETVYYLEHQAADAEAAVLYLYFFHNDSDKFDVGRQYNVYDVDRRTVNQPYSCKCSIDLKISQNHLKTRHGINNEMKLKRATSDSLRVGLLSLLQAIQTQLTDFCRIEKGALFS